MLVASAKHPSMLVYLNQAESTKDAPNENYGREVLELHTVGVDAGYDENDMLQLGQDPHRPHPWPTCIPPFSDANPEWTRLEYFYDWSIHHTAPGHRHGQDVQHPRGPRRRGGANTYLLWLARHPNDRRAPRPQALHALRVRRPAQLAGDPARPRSTPAHDTADRARCSRPCSPAGSSPLPGRAQGPHARYEDTIAGLRTRGPTQSTCPRRPRTRRPLVELRPASDLLAGGGRHGPRSR